MQLYADHGVRFHYPDDWSLAEDRLEAGVCITVAGEGTSFWSISLYEERPRPEDVIDSAVEAFREEYDELDAYSVEARLAGVPNAARDLEFVCLDVLNTACLRSFPAADATAFVLYQGSDRDLEETREALERISASLVCNVPEGPGET
ncbi:MAG: hypothetical protein WED34_07080 [Planctomycetales bacterium]